MRTRKEYNLEGLTGNRKADSTSAGTRHPRSSINDARTLLMIGGVCTTLCCRRLFVSLATNLEARDNVARKACGGCPFASNGIVGCTALLWYSMAECMLCTVYIYCFPICSQPLGLVSKQLHHCSGFPTVKYSKKRYSPNPSQPSRVRSALT